MLLMVLCWRVGYRAAFRGSPNTPWLHNLTKKSNLSLDDSIPYLFFTTSMPRPLAEVTQMYKRRKISRCTSVSQSAPGGIRYTFSQTNKLYGRNVRCFNSTAFFPAASLYLLLWIRIFKAVQHTGGLTLPSVTCFPFSLPLLCYLL